MKCKECDCCKQGYFRNDLKSYICIGVREPFKIDDIYHSCTEYPENYWRTKEEIEKICGKGTVPFPVLTNYDQLRKFDVDQLAEFLDKYSGCEKTPWGEWFDKNYCSKCEPIMCHYELHTRLFPVSWCNLNENMCKYFPEMSDAPNHKEIIKLWLLQQGDTIKHD